MEKLDKKDWKILYQLDLNSRQSNSEIGKKVGLSKEVVNYRINNLMKKGIIKGFYTIIDTSKLGYLSCRFFLKFQKISPEKESEIIDYFTRLPYTWWVPSMDGARDLGVVLWAKDTYEFHKIKEDALNKYRPYIKEIVPGIYSRFHIFKRAYLIKKEINEEQPIVSTKGGNVKYDKTDLRILRTICDNARASIVDIAGNCRTTTAIIMYRLKKLEKDGVIQGYRPIIDLGKIGHYWYKVNLELDDFTKIPEILKYANAHPNIVYAYEVIGGADLELEFEVSSYEEFRKVLNKVRKRFSETIRSYEHFLFFKEHKISYMPKI
ncbi:Lrp/AsnC family transcriptional regulator [Thermoproteota archaeon]